MIVRAADRVLVQGITGTQGTFWSQLERRFRHLGGRPANFLEVGGQAYTLTKSALELALANPRVKSLVVNFCGAFARTDVMTEGVVTAWEELKPTIPVFFSIHGTGEEEAVELLRARLRLEPFDLMDDAISARCRPGRRPRGSWPAARPSDGPRPWSPWSARRRWRARRHRRELGLQYIELDGDVCVLANGAGLTMTTMDMVRYHGGAPANFCEIGGQAYTKAHAALELILSKPGLKSLVVNFCGAFARCDVMMAGLLHAWNEIKPDIPVFFSIAGTGDEEAIRMLDEKLGMKPLADMSAACKAAVAAAKEA